MLWGLFQKLVIADRASLLVNTVINDYANYGFFEISIAVILFAVQIYCDFGGYTNIAIGAAPWRKQKGNIQKIYQYTDCIWSQRIVAWRKLEFCCMGIDSCCFSMLMCGKVSQKFDRPQPSYSVKIKGENR